MSAWIAERFDKYAERTLIALVALVPVVVLPQSLQIFNLAKLTVIWVWGLAAFWFWFSWGRENRAGLPRFNLGFATAAFLAAYLLATLFSQNREISLLGLYGRYGGLLPVAMSAGVMMLVVALFWKKPSGLKAIAVAVAAGSAPVTAYTLIQAAGLDWVAWAEPTGIRAEFPGSTLGNSNFAGGYLAIALPFVGYMAFWVGSWKGRALVGLGFTLSVAALWFTGSRGGMIAAAGGLMSMALIHRDRLPRWSKVGLGAVAASALLVAALILWHPGRDAPPEPLVEKRVFRTDTFRLRSHYWAAAWRIFLDNPVLGTGPDTYKENYETYRLALEPREQGAGTPDKPHNIYLEYAASSGLLGLGTYLTLIGLALKYGLVPRGVLAPDDKVLLSIFISGLVAYSIQGFFSMDLPPFTLLSWLCLAGIAVLADPRLLAERKAGTAAANGVPVSTRKDKAVKKPGSGTGMASRGRALQLTAAVAVAGLVAFGIRPLWADVNARTGMLPKTALPDALGLLKKAAELNPLGATYRNMATVRVGRQARRSPGFEQDVFRDAHRWLLKSEGEDRQNMFIVMNLARVNQLWAEEHDVSRYRIADQWWRRAVQIDPDNWRLRLDYGAFLGDWALRTEDEGAKRRTVSVLEEVAKLNPDQPEVWEALGKSYILTRQIPRARIAMTEALRIRPEYPSARRWLSRLSGPDEPRGAP